ncbi:MAG: hypothetical protein ABFS32_10575 [Bacteroidota bacterium]
MKFKFFILILFSTFILNESALAQCANKIDVTSEIDATTELGKITIEVTSDEEYSCTLLIETAEGETVVEEQRNSGNKTIEFSNLETGLLYSVWVRFPDSQNIICSSLRKTVFLKR